ncbi:pentapeptide repeat-containing protein [Buttiauxella sp. S04-F03]|uniref:anti-phage Hailong system effector protein HalA n=1 Tax=Buttiauxella sp. W03-F01 TaxID=2904524 RepID=UPI001E6204EF|nr:pentapeptide repeat-containing protein [Buttiauxella sp. W03-F01]MCE0801589.1 pentapeptide repeat-containing protein [Buttiauxella sp. W03-F01]
MSGSIRQHRLKNFWDVTYDPEISLDDFQSWDVADLNLNGKNNSGPRKVAIDLTTPTLYTPGTKLILAKKNVSLYENKQFSGYIFTECDIFGDNKGKRITFKDCEFRKVCFGYSNLSNVKFTNCKFKQCSFSMANFENCQFNNCQYEKISYSGNETKFLNTYIDAQKIVKALFINTNKDICDKEGTTPEYQVFRSYGTKTKFSKIILNSLSTIPDDDAYYKAVKTHSQCKQKSKKENIKFKIERSGILKNIMQYPWLLSSIIESAIVNASGSVNGWGGSLFKCILIGLLITIAFACCYFTFFNVPILNSLIMSLDITLLAGYTKHATNIISPAKQIVYLINMIIGLWWYGILIPTLINKICTSRT